MEFSVLKEQALAYAKHREINNFITCGSVAAAILTGEGKVYVGISIDTACSMGFCAEHGAVAEMLKHQEVKIEKVIAVTDSGTIVPPCGRCRELMSQLTQENNLTQVMINEDTIVTLESLLPADWKPHVVKHW
ncbi:cytidine deaminase [Myroides sp. mNGS23_01]|nr:cytidine deaminase [Myroides sp. mNGS23_01]WHT39315.1 cytidine deaminase [Myroides sp. mNGS23_01]